MTGEDIASVAETLLALYLQREDVYFALRNHLEREFFHISPDLKRVYVLLEKFVDRNDTHPTQEAFFHYLGALKTKDAELQKAIIQTVKRLYDLDIDLEEGVKKTVAYYSKILRNATVRHNLVTDFSEVYDRLMTSDDPLEDYRPLFEELNTCLKPLNTDGFGDDFFNLFDLNAMKDGADKVFGDKLRYRRVSTHIPTLNRSMDGGMLPGETAFILGRDKGFKSTFCMNLAMHTMLQRKRALYVNLEIVKERVKQRLFQHVLQKPTKLLRSSHHEVMDNFTSYIKANKQYEAFAPDFWTPRDPAIRTMDGISAKIQERKIQGVHYDLVIIDYVDVLSMIGGIKSEWQDANANYIAMEQLALLHDTVILSPGQVDNAGIDAMDNNKPMKSYYTTVSKRKKDHCSYLFCNYLNDEMRKRNNIDIVMLASRNEKFLTAHCKVDPTTGRIWEDAA